MTELEELRASLNQKWGATRGKLTLLPLLARAMVVALRDFPQINARYDDEAGVVTRYGAVHIGMRHAEPRRLSSGSTITITSLGPLGGIVTTPVINHPEVGIVGVNRIVERPAIRNGAVVARKLMNLSSSFDHRVVDGMDAARFIQACARCLNNPRCFSWSKHEPDHKNNGPAGDRRRPGRLRGRHPRRSAGRAHHPGRRRPAGRHLPEHRLHPVQGADSRGRGIRQGAPLRRRVGAGHLGAGASIDIARTVVWKDGIVSRLTSGARARC